MEDQHRSSGAGDEAPSSTPSPPPRAVGAGRWRWLRRGRWMLAVLLPLVSLSCAFALDRAWHGGRALRGVRLGAVAVGGMDRAAMVATCARLEQQRRSSVVSLRIAGRRFELRADAVDYRLRADAMVGRALAAGRDGGLLTQLAWWLARWFGPERIAIEGRIDEAAVAERLGRWAAEAIEDPPFAGAVEIRAGRPTVRPPRAGRVLDLEAAGATLVERISRPRDGDLPLALVRRDPRCSAQDVERAAAEARKLLAGPVVLVAEGPPPAVGAHRSGGAAKRGRHRPTPDEEAAQAPRRFDFAPAVLARALRSRPAGDGAAALALYFAPGALSDALAPARRRLAHGPVDAKFVVDRRDRVSIVPSERAVSIEAGQVAEALLAAARSPERSGLLPLTLGEQPELTTAAAKALGIAGLVAKFTTRHPCCRPRVKNIHRIAELIDGVVVPPGERFSINQQVGPRTAAKGFVPAPTIVHGKMKDTVGGGVSQFATTFFNAAFYGGYEIVERQPHSYYFSRYPMGHEATLSYPEPDVIIRNDTKAGLLIRTYYGPTSITVKMYGDNGGRKVRREVSRPRDFVDPPIEYIADRKREPDDEKVVARGRKGWTVIVARITRYPDGKTKREQRKVVYRPRVRKVRVHPCVIPKGEKGHTGEPCPEPEDESSTPEQSGATGGPAPERGYDPLEQQAPGEGDGEDDAPLDAGG